MSKFSLTSVIDNVHVLMCMNDKFFLTSFALTSRICWCERINKFSLTSFHCSQQNNYTADDKKTKHGAPLIGAIAVSYHKNKTAVRPQFLNFPSKPYRQASSAMCQYFLPCQVHASFWTSALVKEKSRHVILYTPANKICQVRTCQ